MVTSLVTGGAGFIGSHVAEQCLKMRQQVVVLDDLSGGFRTNVPDGAEFIKGSILDIALISRLFEEYHFNYVYHFGAYAAEGLSHFIKRFNYLSNLVGTVNLINASVNYQTQCLVFTSSIAVYGAGQSPMNEEMIPVPEDSYGIAKLACEQELKITHKMFGLNYVIFRPHNVYGERQNIADRYRNVVGIFMNQILKNEPMTIFGDGEQQRAFTYIEDVAPIIARSPQISEAQNQIFNLGADTPYSVNALAKMISQTMGVENRVSHLEARNEVQVAFSDHSKADRVFGFRSKTSLEAGIRRMAAWVKTYGAEKVAFLARLKLQRTCQKVGLGQ